MNSKIGVILAAMVVAADVMAQTATNSTPQAGATSATGSAPRSTSSSSTARRSGGSTTTRRGARSAAETPPAIPLTTNALAVAKQGNINVRAQAKIESEIVGKLKQGEEVLVLEEINTKGEPAKWAKIKLPAGPHVWVNSSYLDANHTVTPAKLNVRAGAGENFSILGVLHKGDTVKVVDTKGEWTAIEPPEVAYAFVAAHLLMPKPPVVVPDPPVTTTIVQNQTPVTPPTNVPSIAPVGMTNVSSNPTVPDPKTAPVDEGPPPKRIVQREGIVGGTVSIQAPSYYQLESLETGKPIDYLYTTSTNLPLSRYKGLTVLVTGEESLDERWANTPVLTISRIQVVQ